MNDKLTFMNIKFKTIDTRLSTRAYVHVHPIDNKINNDSDT